MLHKKYSIHQAHIHWQSESYYGLSIFRTNLFAAPSETEIDAYVNEANSVNKDSPIAKTAATDRGISTKRRT